MAFVVFYAVRLPLVVRVDKRHRERILRVHAPVVAQRERPIERGVGDWAPEIDDLEPAREQLRHVGRGQVAVDARDGRRGSLVDVHLWHRLALIRRVFGRAWDVAADR